MSDIRFTFGGDPTDAARASERVETKLEQLQRQAVQTNAALRAMGAPRSGSIAQLGASAGRERRNVDLLEGSLGRVVGTMTKVNIQFRFFQNLMSLIKWPAMISAVGLLTQGLSALAGGIVAVTGALAPMVNSVLALPAGISVLVQSIGTLKLAFGGLDDALKAQKTGTTAVQDAQLKLESAMKNHREVVKEARKGSLEYRESLLEVRQAQHALTDAQEAANPALERFAAFIDQRLEPALGRLRRSASAGIIPGLTQGITSALGNLPGIERIVGRTAGVLGAGAAGLGDMFGGRGRDIQQIGGTNIRIITQLSSAMTSLAGAVTDLMVAGGPFVVWLARGVNEFAQWAERATFAGRRSGELRQALDGAKEALQLMWGVLRPFGAALINIFQAAAPLGREIMEDLGGAAESFKAWTESAEGQNRLERYFREVKPTLYEVGRLARDLTTTFFRLGADPGFTDFIRKVRVDLLPTIERLVRETTAQFGPALTDALVAIADLIATLAGSSGPLTLFVTAIGHMARFFTQILEAAPIVRDALFTLVGFATTLAAVKFTSTITGLAAVLGLMRNISGFQGRAAATPGFLPGIVAGAAGARGRTVGGPLPTAATRGSIAPTSGFGQVPTGVAFAPQPQIGRFARFGAPAAGIGGLVATGAGVSLGGVAGGVLGGAGLGVALGAPAGPVGMAIGGAVGGIGGGLLAALSGLGSAAPQVDKLAASLNMLGQSFRNAGNAATSIEVANESVRDTSLNLSAANIQVARSEQNLSLIRKQFGRNSLEYREAVIALKMAEENRADALEAHQRAEKEQAQARERNRVATQNLWRELRVEHSETRGLVETAKERYQWGRKVGEQTNDAKRAVAEHAERVAGFTERMRKMSGVLRSQGRPELAKVAEAAERVANRINDIPTDVQIKAEIEFFARFNNIDIVESHRSEMSAKGAAGGSKTGATRDGPGGPTDRWFNDQVNAAIMGGARRYIRQNRRAILARVKPAGGDVVSVGRWLQSKGFLVGEHPAFGGVTPGVHVKNSYHYRGRAIDVNYPGGGAAEMSALDKVHPILAGMHPAELLWRTAGHFDHLHVAFRRGGRVPFLGLGGDSVPAMLSPGEAVLTQSGQQMVDILGGPGTMQRILAEQAPHFQTGGKVQAATDRADRIRGMLERLELRHELSGTGTTSSELLAQAQFIRRRVIPAEKGELRALERARKRALENGNKELARELKRQIFDQQTEILRLQLDAEQRTRQAAEETAQSMREFGGGIGFQFGSSIFTDRLLGSMVGA